MGLASEMSLMGRLRLIGLMMVGGMLLLAAWLCWVQYQRSYDERKLATRQAVEVARGVLDWAHGLEKSGALSREQAQKLAGSAIAKLRYAGGNYFSIYDMGATIVMHPIKPELVGKGRDTKDANGKLIVQLMVDEARQHKEGYVDYVWPKPGEQHPSEKLAFAQGFEPWGWVVSSGLYVDDLRRDFASYAWRAGLIACVAASLLWLLLRRIGRGIVGGVQDAMRTADAIAGGDLSVQVPSGRSGEVGRLLDALRRMAGSLQAMVGEVRTSAQTMQAAVAGIAAGNTDLSDRTQRTAANLQSTVAAVEQIKRSLAEGALATDTASETVLGAADSATRGGAVVSDVVTAMSDINASSKRINEIIGVIDGIAFQTNILALNAAVEAARAGEQGRGFAVVAAEVRQLAQRSAQAAREIKGLIGSSAERVEQGTLLVGNAGQTMKELVTAVQRTNEIMNGMRALSGEQSSGIALVSASVTELDRMTSQNAVLVQQSSEGAGSLQVQAERLLNAVQAFKLAAST